MRFIYTHWRITMKFNKKLLAATLITAGGFAAISSANAADTGTFAVSMTITKACNITTGDNANISLGSVAGGAQSVTGQSSVTGITVNCTNLTPYNIALSTTSDATGGTGKMLGGVSENIPYILYSDAGTTVWGAAVDKSNTVSGQGDGMLTTAKSHQVHAITGIADVSVGTYTDTVTATILY